MTTHETIDSRQEIEPGSDRSFGLIVGGVLVAIAILLFFREEPSFLWILAPGVLLMLVGLIRPGWLHRLNLAWTRLGLLLGRLISPIVMFLVYTISVVPTAMVLRLAGKDLLGLRRKGEGDTYWISRSPPGPPPDSLKDQF